MTLLNTNDWVLLLGVLLGMGGFLWYVVEGLAKPVVRGRAGSSSGRNPGDHAERAFHAWWSQHWTEFLPGMYYPARVAWLESWRQREEAPRPWSHTSPSTLAP